MNELDGKTQSSWPNNKKFSLSDKAAILKEIQERAGELDYSTLLDDLCGSFWNVM